MDLSSLIRRRLDELRLNQKDLARAAQVTESYISQLLARKKVPPAPGRTDIYEKMGGLLKLPVEELSKLAEAQRQSESNRQVEDRPEPLLHGCRALIIRKCNPDRRPDVRRIFEKESFGEMERLITQRIVSVAQDIVREGMHRAEWLRVMSRISGRSASDAGAAVEAFAAGGDVLFNATDLCASMLDLIVDRWDIDLKTFRVEVVPNPKLAPRGSKRFGFVELEPSAPSVMERGFELFLKDKALSRDITEVEREFLARLKFTDRRPTALYYYRELQNLRDPLHFTEATR